MFLNLRKYLQKWKWSLFFWTNFVNFCGFIYLTSAWIWHSSICVNLATGTNCDENFLSHDLLRLVWGKIDLEEAAMWLREMSVPSTIAAYLVLSSQLGISRQLCSSIDKFEVLLLVILFHFIEYLPEPVNDLLWITLIIIVNI